MPASGFVEARQIGPFPILFRLCDATVADFPFPLRLHACEAARGNRGPLCVRFPNVIPYSLWHQETSHRLSEP